MTLMSIKNSYASNKDSSRQTLPSKMKTDIQVRPKYHRVIQESKEAKDTHLEPVCKVSLARQNSAECHLK